MSFPAGSSFVFCLGLVLLSSALVNGNEPAQPKDRAKQTVTDPAKADADFADQGEYLGQVGWPGERPAAAGLQVIALGDGQFEAVLLRGGLPGAGWNGTAREKLDGGRTSHGVQMVGWLGSMRVRGGRAEFFDAHGFSAGSLQRIERLSPTIGALPPPRAVVLFNEQEKNLEQFTGAKLTAEGYLHSGLLTKMKVGDFRLHLEFRTPYMPFARGQARANSGVYIQQRYELQILDSFGLKGEADECGGLYRQTPPDVNMCLPPLAWQTYDIDFTAARWSADGKTKIAPARITAFHNGVGIHERRVITVKTGGGKAEGPEEFPINLQDHGNPVAFRNVWLVNGTPTAEEHRGPLAVAKKCDPNPIYSPGWWIGPCDGYATFPATYQACR